MPKEGIQLTPKLHLLTTDELLYLAKLFVSQGVNKIRLTGGEPTLNKDLKSIIEYLNQLPAVRTIGMTSNGLVLAKMLPDLRKAGLNALNISLDTLKQDKFESITRRKGWSRVMDAIDLAIDLGYNPVKVNCVIMRDFNENEVTDFVALTENKSIDVRFIEYMPFDGNEWSKNKFIPYKQLIKTIKNQFPTMEKLTLPDNHISKPYKIPGFKGQFGFISTVSEQFCGSCNRLRLLADGSLKVCLLGTAEFSLRDAIRNNCSEDDLLAMIEAAIMRKKKQHAGLKNSRKSNIGPQAGYCFGNYGYFYKLGKNICHEIRRNYCTNSKDNLSHINSAGELRMIDVGNKIEVSRYASAYASVHVGECVSNLISKNLLKKGDVLSVARMAGICGAKRTSELIPLCHNITLSFIDVKVTLDSTVVNVVSFVRSYGKTGVEMEALTAASIAALTIYDMCKSVSHNIVINNVRLLEKTGGRRDFKIKNFTADLPPE